MIQEHYSLYTTLVSLGLFCGMLAAMEAGARWALRRGDKKEVKGAGAIEGAVFALLGLLIALTFAGSADRITERSKLAIDESDALGTAFMRLDVLPNPERDDLRRILREYAGLRIDEYSHMQVRAEHEMSRERTAVVRDLLWTKAVPAAARSKYPHASQLLLPLLNDSFDISGRREAVRRIHPPTPIYAILVIVSLLAAVLAGYSLADPERRRWLHRLSFAAATSATFFVTLNMEYPRLGIIDMGSRDLVLRETLAEMDRVIAAQAVAKPFSATMTLQGIRFKVSCANDSTRNKLTIVPGGLEKGASAIVREIDGLVTGAEAADLDSDGSPELYVYVQSGGSGSYGSLVAYAVNKRKSLSEIHLPEPAEGAAAFQGYMGHDEFAVVESSLARRFPVYRAGDTNSHPTGGMRQLEYKLTPGEAGWLLKLVKTAEY